MKRTTVAIVAIHFVVVVLHSIAHNKLPVEATPAQLAFILPVIVVAPVVAVIMLAKFEKAGMVLLTASMLGSLVFGVYFHFVADTIDHVGHVMHREPHLWAQMFLITSYLLAVTEAGAVAVGLIWFTRQNKPLTAA